MNFPHDDELKAQECLERTVAKHWNANAASVSTR